jgi:hypothetical protein
VRASAGAEHGAGGGNGKFHDNSMPKVRS